MKPPERVQTKKEMFAIDKILCHRGEGGQRRYLVRWQGYPKDVDSWEPPENFTEGVITGYLNDNPVLADQYGKKRPATSSNETQTPNKKTKVETTSTRREIVLPDIGLPSLEDSEHDLFMEFEPPWPSSRDLDDSESKNISESLQRDISLVVSQGDHARNLLQQLNAIAADL